MFIDQRTRIRPTRADRSRASFEKQCKRERHGSLSFLPTFLRRSRCCFCLPSDPLLLSLSFSPTLLSSSLPFNHTCPPSLSPFLTFTILFRSIPCSSALPSSRRTLLVPACYALFLSFQLDHLFSYLSPPPPPHFFRLSLLFSRYLPRLLSSCPCSLFCPSFFIFRSFLPISSSRIFIIVLLLSRSSTSPTIGVFPLPTLSSPTLSVYLARFASPAGHPQSSFSFSRLLSPFNRCFVFLSFSLSYFELRRSTYIFLGQSPSSSHNATSSFATCLPCSPKRARGGSTHHRLIHDYYHLIRPPAFFIVPFTKHEPGKARNIFCL